MAVLYSNDFESGDSNPATGWTTLDGSGMQVFQASIVSLTAPRGTRVIGRNAVGDAATCNAVATPIGNQAMRIAYRVNDITNLRIAGPILRVQSKLQHYRFLLESDGANLTGRIVKYDSGSYPLATSAAVAAATGDVIHIEVYAIGSALSMYFWKAGQSKPGTPNVSATDTAYPTGLVGLMKFGASGVYGVADDVVITDGAGGEDYFYASAAGPSITTQPSNTTVTAPSTATFTVAASATGGGTLSYQWQRSTNSGGSWSNVSTGTGGTTASYTTAATSVTGGSANNADQYRCAVTETGGTNAGTVNSSAAILTVNAAAAGPTINTQPSSSTVTAPATATFTVAATTSGGALSYQWQRNSANISGANSASYTTPDTTVTGGSANSGDLYRCVVTDSNGSTTSSAATLTVNPAPGVLTFQAAGMEFGRRTGLAISTFALDASSNYRYTVHADALVLGAAVYTSGVVTTDSSGKLPNLSNGALTTGATYRVVAVRQADGEAATFRMVAA